MLLHEVLVNPAIPYNLTIPNVHDSESDGSTPRQLTDEVCTLVTGVDCDATLYGPNCGIDCSANDPYCGKYVYVYTDLTWDQTGPVDPSVLTWDG